MGKLDGAKVLITGATGFLGRFVARQVSEEGAQVIPLSKRLGYDIRNEAEFLQALVYDKPDIIIHLAATVGGIGANMAKPATFFRDNMLMGMNVVHAASIAGCKLVNVSTTCGYPKHCKVPFREEDFWEGFPEETNAPYGVAKKALQVMCQAYRKQYDLHYAYLVPANMFGPGDNFDEKTSHVIPAMIRKFAEAAQAGAPEVTCWGTGKATRSFLYATDAAKAITIACTELDSDKIVNLPGSDEISMKALATLVAKVTKFKGTINWDATKPDGQPRRALDGARARALLGWAPDTTLETGLQATVDWYLEDRKSRKV